MPAICTATRRDGRPCSAPALPSSAQQRCFAHDDALKGARAAGGRGRSRSNRAAKLLPAMLRPLLDSLLAAVDEVHAGELEPQRANAMASLAGAVVKVYQVGALEERVQALETRLLMERTA